MNFSIAHLVKRQSSSPIVFHDASYITIYDFERNYDVAAWHVWISEHWPRSIVISAFYFLSIYVLQNVMRNRKPFKLKRTLIIWNSLLAVFSMACFIRISPEFFRVVFAKNGFHNSVCNWTEPHNYATAFWGAQFIISKVYELVDTLFIILRKKKLIFLHCYHHAMTLIAGCAIAVLYEPHQLWYIVLNSFIHSIMYSYYAIKAADFKVPRRVSMIITTLQIVQFIIALAVNIYGFAMWFQGKESECPRSSLGLRMCFVVGLSYLVLFAHFFYKAYIAPNKFTKAPKINRTSDFKIESTEKLSQRRNWWDWISLTHF